MFIVTAQAAGPVPVDFLLRVQGFRPLQAHFVTLEVATLQQRADILTFSDTFLILAAVIGTLSLIVMTLPKRTRPPRIELG